MTSSAHSLTHNAVLHMTETERCLKFRFTEIVCVLNKGAWKQIGGRCGQRHSSSLSMDGSMNSLEEHGASWKYYCSVALVVGNAERLWLTCFPRGHLLMNYVTFLWKRKQFFQENAKKYLELCLLACLCSSDARADPNWAVHHGRPAVICGFESYKKMSGRVWSCWLEWLLLFPF